MISSLEARLASAWRAHRRMAALAGFGLAAALASTVSVSTQAHAQYYDGPDRFYGYGYGYDYDGPGPEMLRPDRPTEVPLATIRQRVAQRGMHLIATPRRKGRIYLAEAEDARGIRHRLVFDAMEGRLVEDTVLGPKVPLPNPNHATLPKPPQRALTDEPSKVVLDPAKDKDKEKAPVKTDKPIKDQETTQPAPQAK
jgi:hypothetical protein